MTDDNIPARLEALEEGHAEQRRRWVYSATRTAGLHDPALIADRLVDTSKVVTVADADRRVAERAAEHPYLRTGPEQITADRS